MVGSGGVGVVGSSMCEKLSIYFECVSMKSRSDFVRQVLLICRDKFITKKLYKILSALNYRALRRGRKEL